MADKQLLAQNSSPNGCIVAAIAGSNPNHHSNNNNNNNNQLKLVNCSNGDINDINGKNGNVMKFASELNGYVSEKTASSINEPPDGGARAWCVMISAFFCNSIIFGIINVFGTIYIKLFEYLKESGDPEAASKACKL